LGEVAGIGRFLLGLNTLRKPEQLSR
jgi:hypothetical protein